MKLGNPWVLILFIFFVILTIWALGDFHNDCGLPDNIAMEIANRACHDLELYCSDKAKIKSLSGDAKLLIFSDADYYINCTSKKLYQYNNESDFISEPIRKISFVNTDIMNKPDNEKSKEIIEFYKDKLELEDASLVDIKSDSHKDVGDYWSVILKEPRSTIHLGIHKKSGALLFYRRNLNFKG